MRKALSHDAYVRKLNRQMRKHPNYRKGLQVTRVNGSLYEMAFGEPLDPQNPADLQKLREDLDLQRVLWDSVAIVRRKYYYLSDQMRSRMLPRNLLFRLSREGCRSVLLQSRLKSLYDAIFEYKQSEDSWPADAARLIESHRLMDPWSPGRVLQVKYIVPKEGPSGANQQDVLAEYTTPQGRKFVLYADGHQETWRP
jgi:hypothetical protein